MATETLRPNAVGYVSGLDAHPGTGEEDYEDVDEVTADEDTTYLYRATDYRLSAFNLPAGCGIGVITSVTVYIRCRATTTPDQWSARTIARTHDTVYTGTQQTLTTSYADSSKAYITNPNTGEAWTWEEIDALEIGVQMRRPHSVDAGESRCTQVYVEVDYTPLVVGRSFGYIIG